MTAESVASLNLANSKLTVVGAGSVGTSIAYAALIRGSARQIALYDIDAKKVDAEVHDLAHGTQFTPTSIVSGGADIEVVKDSSVIIITAGARQKPGQTRLDLAGVNAGIMTKLVPQLLEQAPNAVLVLVTNPCDVLTVVAQKVSGLPVHRVLSTGTLLDTSRLRWAIAKRAGVSLSNVHAAMFGEHGDTEFPIWSSASIAQIPIRDWTDDAGQKLFSEEELAMIAYDTVHAAYSIIEGKGATNYAIGLAGARLVEAIIGDQHKIWPLSSVLTDYRGISGIALSVPSLVGPTGIERVYEFPMDAHEIALLNKSAAAIRATLKAVGY
ncbi:L-lactate dehydrogenase [Propionicimonas sp.]|uniref:L-lactate dehydrogenase n=1 Tax=Propionicimonas sp. TaxID=1955623 RepID=UPI0039E66100